MLSDAVQISFAHVRLTLPFGFAELANTIHEQVDLDPGKFLSKAGMLPFPRATSCLRLLGAEQFAFIKNQPSSLTVQLAFLFHLTPLTEAVAAAQSHLRVRP